MNGTTESGIFYSGLSVTFGSKFWHGLFTDFVAADSLGDGSGISLAAVQAPSTPILLDSSLSPSLAFAVYSVSVLFDLWKGRHLTRGALRKFVDDCSFEQFFSVPVLSSASSGALQRGRSALDTRCFFSVWPSVPRLLV